MPCCHVPITTQGMSLYINFSIRILRTGRQAEQLGELPRWSRAWHSAFWNCKPHSSVGCINTECRCRVPLDCHCSSYSVYRNGSCSLLVALSPPFNTNVSVKPCCSDNHVLVIGLRGEFLGKKKLKLTISEWKRNIYIVFQWHRNGWHVDLLGNNSNLDTGNVEYKIEEYMKLPLLPFLF